MAESEVINIINEFESLEETIKMLKKQQELAKAKLVSYLNGNDQAIVGDRVIRNTETISNRFDTKRFKTDFGNDAYAEYTRPIVTFRFTIS